MIFDDSLIEQIKATVDSGYYDRLRPPRRERKSLVESIEKKHANGDLPIIVELKCADPREGQLFSNREFAIEALDSLGGFVPSAFSVWSEPKFHASDARWLARELPVPVLAKDYIISEKQMVGGDAVMLSAQLLSAAKIDPHPLIEAAHDLDFEVVMEVCDASQMEAALHTEADAFAINNYGPNGSPATIKTTLELLSGNSTGRPVISSGGISEPEHIRALIGCGTAAVEIGPKIWAAEDAHEHLSQLARAVGGREPINPLAQIKEIKAA